MDRFEPDERSVLRPLAPQPYRRAGAATPADAAPRSLPKVDVQRRSLRTYAQLVR